MKGTSALQRMRIGLVSLATLGALAALGACDDTGRTPATVALVARGSSSPVLVDGAWTVTLTRAELAFGPAYFCATSASSSELCETAVLETRETHPFDALDPIDQPLGELVGVTGNIRSAQYDLGIPFLLTQSAPTPLAAAVDGHSLVLEATATDGVTTFDLEVAMDATAGVSGNTLIVGAAIVAEVPARGGVMTASVDPRNWLRGLDWAALASTPRDPGEPVVLARGSLAYDAVLRGLTANHPPTLTFDAP